MQTIQQSIKKSKALKSKDKVQKVQIIQKQYKFNNRYSLNQKPKHYDALKDPYTSYYFSNKGVKQHLKQLKKALRFQPNLTEKSKLNQLINVRLKEKFDDVINPKTSIYQRELNSKDKLYLNQSSAKSIRVVTKRVYGSMKQEQSKQAGGQGKNGTLPKLKHEELLVNNKVDTNVQSEQTQHQKQKQEHKKVIDSIKKQKLFSNRLAQELHDKKHKKWLQFLQQKRKLFIKVQQTQSNK